ncbi:MAG: hypothetical protein LBS46_01075 [Dysgonamonadaceae bacterium]|jgi:hypothetical protein|nr:hypothetical protein [Dysgonamonadaceae bacterium]
MEIEILQGTEKRLYDLIAPLVLNPIVIRQNGGVAFKTTRKHIWVVVISDDEKCTGFLPVQINNHIGKINNYYIKDRDGELLSSLLKRTLEYAKKQNMKAIDIITQIQDYETVQKHGFETETQFVNYTRFRKRL